MFKGYCIGFACGAITSLAGCLLGIWTAAHAALGKVNPQ
jgi:hypothetical protein